MQLEVFRDRRLRLLERRRRGQLHLRSPLRIQARSSQPLALRGVQDEGGIQDPERIGPKSRQHLASDQASYEARQIGAPRHAKQPAPQRRLLV